jgi:hypothetical protein
VLKDSLELWAFSDPFGWFPPPPLWFPLTISAQSKLILFMSSFPFHMSQSLLFSHSISKLWYCGVRVWSEYTCCHSLGQR